MNKKLNIIIILICFGVYLSACGKQYDIELIADDSVSDVLAVSDVQETQIQAEENFSLIHICGAVMEPGVYEVPSDSRIFEVLNLAGGFTDDAATDAVNLAMKVIDGSKIWIPTLAEADEQRQERSWGSEETDTTVSETTRLVNINTAGLDVLMTLPGIGKAKAESIIEYREEKGKFTKVEDIMKITGIKDGVFNKIKDMICI
ncbi:MAG: helix-hairpin-helix domain-containing protein [Lachnospiraceae bacterium]|nr:helix-hairpin-helix domain-containing protein [Lachnospiraceae bacterium]